MAVVLQRQALGHGLRASRKAEQNKSKGLLSAVDKSVCCRSLLYVHLPLPHNVPLHYPLPPQSQTAWQQGKSLK